jgi:hypothetical protein
MKGVIIVILALVLFFGVFFSQVMAGIDDWRTDQASENFLASTGPGITAANVTLSYDLYQAVLAEIESITSSDGTDTPVATAYDEDYKLLTVSGLVPSATRTLAIAYTAESTNQAMRTAGPWLGLLVVGGVVYFIFKVRNRR